MTTEEIKQAPIRLNPLENDQMQCEKCGKQRKIFRVCATEYSEKTSIHGVKYLGEGDRPIWEKIFWILIFIVSLYYCISMILNVWYKWIDSPFLVSFNERETTISTIPFPSVTICPLTKSDPEIFNITDASIRLGYNNVTEIEKKFIAAFSQVCDFQKDVSNFPTDIDSLGIINLLHLKPIMMCIWKNKEVDCERLFRKVITDSGICYNFNGMDPEELYRKESLPRNFENFTSIKNSWNRYSGYEQHSEDNTYPKRALSPRTGLTITFAVQNLQKDGYCMMSSGNRIVLNTPDDVPQSEESYFTIPWGKKVTTKISPSMLITPVALKSYSPEKRQCYFDDERYLRHFKLYTQNNCNLECIANFTLKHCGCVRFSMPRISSTPVCNVKQLSCIEDAENKFILKEFERKVVGDATDYGECNCLRSCTQLEYNAEIFEFKYALGEALSKQFPDLELTNYSFSVFDLSFEENEFLASKRSELYGIADLLSNWGGLLGLFMGISVLSFIEIFYFSTLRLYSDHWIRKRGIHSYPCQHHQ